MLEERDGKDVGNEDDNDEYGKDGDIPDKLFNFFHATTNQKHAGVMEGGWDRPHNRARTLGESDGNNEGDKDDDNEYCEDGDIPNDDDKYAGVCNIHCAMYIWFWQPSRFDFRCPCPRSSRFDIR
jgi:hypothetical protein